MMRGWAPIEAQGHIVEFGGGGLLTHSSGDFHLEAPNCGNNVDVEDGRSGYGRGPLSDRVPAEAIAVVGGGVVPGDATIGHWAGIVSRETGSCERDQVLSVITDFLGPV